jgi:hypothetical protein
MIGAAPGPLLHNVQGPDGAYPVGLVEGTDGDLYGTTYRGGEEQSSPIIS